MKKINLLSKTIVLLLVALILVFTLSLKNESIFHIRKLEVNLRYLSEITAWEIISTAFFLCCFISLFFFYFQLNYLIPVAGA